MSDGSIASRGLHNNSNGHASEEDAFISTRAVAATTEADNRKLQGALEAARAGILEFQLWGIVSAQDGMLMCGCEKGADCDNPGKHPTREGWQARATTEEEEIRAWWTSRDGRYYNAGTPTGARAGRVILDIDPRHGGDESLRALEAEYGPLPDTVEVLTGGGGRQLHFLHPGPEWEVPNSAGKVGLGLDIRGEGGLGVLPPSMHKSGNAYEWEVSHHPADVDEAPMPDWLLKAAGCHPAISRPASAPKDNPREGIVVPDGQRGEWLFRRACELRRGGLGEPAIHDALVAANKTQCVPPVDDERLAAIIKRVATKIDIDDDNATFSLNGASTPVHDSQPPIGSVNRERTTAPPGPVSFADVIDNPPPPRVWVIDSFMPGGNMPTLIHAEQGSVKSYLGLYLGMCVSTGEPFLDMHANQRPVAYLDFELGTLEQKRRARAIAQGMGPQLLGGNFAYLPWMGYSFADVRKDMVAWLKENPSAVVIIDSFGAASTGDIKAEEQVIKFMRNLRALNTEAVCIIDHQSRLQPGQDYSSKGAYGNIYKENLSRMIWQVELADNSQTSVQVFLRHRKNSFGPRGEGIGVEVTFSDSDFGEVVQLSRAAITDSVYARKASTRVRIKAALQEMGAGTAKEIADHIGAELGTVRNSLTSLKKVSAVVEAAARHDGEAVYTLVPEATFEGPQ